MRLKTFKKYFIAGAFALVVATAVTPLVAFAQAGDGGVGVSDPKSDDFQLIPCNGTTVPCDFNMVIILANRIIKFLLYLSIPLVMGMILYTGWLYLTANGETGQIEKAKKMFVPVILGLFWIGAAYILVYTVIDKFVSDQFAESSKEAVKILK